MDLLLLGLQFLTLLGLGAAALLFRNYLPSYLTKKGENLATKEDIEEITNKIERIRGAYAADLEHLRSSLHIAAQQHTSFSEEQRQALFQFFDHCVQLLADKLQVNLGDLPIDQGQSLATHQQTITDLFTHLILDYYRIILYFQSDSALPTAAAEVIKHSVEARRAFKKHFGRVKLAFIKETESYGSEDSSEMHGAVELAVNATKEYDAAINPHISEMHQAFQTYMQKLNSYLQRRGSAFLLDRVEDVTGEAK